MKILRFILLTCFLGVISPNVFSQAQSSVRLEYVKKYKDIAIRQMKAHGIPASIILAQACLESADGKSKLAINANNHFGIKCDKYWKGEKVVHTSDDANKYFRKYKQVEDSFKDHSDFLCKRKHYESLFLLDIKDYKGWAHGLKKAGYATNPAYAERLIKIIEEYKLYIYDEEKAENEVWQM